MNKLRIEILENNLRDLLGQQRELEQMTDFANTTLLEAYMENDATLTQVDTQEMIDDLMK